MQCNDWWSGQVICLPSIQCEIEIFGFFMIEPSLLFSAAKAAQGMQMFVNLSVRPSRLSFRLIYYYILFTIIFYNSKSD